MSSCIKNLLIVGANSDIAKTLIDILPDDINIFACSRKPDNTFERRNFKNFYLDLCNEKSFEQLKEVFTGLKFDAIVNFAGIAIASPVVYLNPSELKKQLDVSVIGFSRLLSFVYPNLDKKSKVINISSMASFGIFPFISPYCLSKAAADILLNSFEVETGIKTVSIKPGVVRTKFWDYCIDLNQQNFKNFTGDYDEVGKFLLDNAKNASLKGVTPFNVARLIYKVLLCKNPKNSYTVGMDAKIASLTKFIPREILNKIIFYILKYRVRNFKI